MTLDASESPRTPVREAWAEAQARQAAPGRSIVRQKVPETCEAGQAVYVGTHSIRAYSDGPIEFDINRDNAETGGYALICISGYLADA
jgi:hypothetical protein